MGHYRHMSSDRIASVYWLWFGILTSRQYVIEGTYMNIWVILLILLIFGAFGGGYAGWYPHSFGFGGGGLLLIILLVLLFTGRFG